MPAFMRASLGKVWVSKGGSLESGRVDKKASLLSMLSRMKKGNYLQITTHMLLFALSAALIIGCSSGCKRAERAISGKRYVVLSPEIAEIIAAIEGTDNIVGVTEECTFPAVLNSKEKVGKFGTLNKEKIVALKPSIVFASALEQQAIAAELTKLEIKVHTVYPKNLAEMLEGIKSVGDAIGNKDRAAFVADSLQSELNQIRAKSAGKYRPKVYLEIYREPLMSVSDKSFVGELIELAGGDNIFSELERDYARVSPEAVIKASPDIIICYSKDSKENIKKRLGWQNISATQNDRIYFEQDIDPDWLLRAGPRCVKGAARLQEILYNEK